VLHAIEQVPEVQEGFPLALPHTTPQPPQWLRLLVTFVSQPLPLIVSQSPQPLLHAMEHTLAVQEGVPLAVPQAALHAPQ
jgi:hypothetical protein